MNITVWHLKILYICKQNSYAGREVNGDKYMEENESADMDCSVVRIFDANSENNWPPTSTNFVLGGYPLMRMPFVADGRTRDYLTGEASLITWYVTDGTVRDQKMC